MITVIVTVTVGILVTVALTMAIMATESSRSHKGVGSLVVLSTVAQVIMTATVGIKVTMRRSRRDAGLWLFSRCVWVMVK